MSDQPELLPCPFCGSAPYLRKVGNESTKSRGFDIGCRNPVCRFHRSDRVKVKPLEWLLPRAVEAWNRRAHRGTAHRQGWREGMEEAAGIVREARGLEELIGAREQSELYRRLADTIRARIKEREGDE